LETELGRHDDALARVVAERTEGNPFFVIEFGRLLSEVPEVIRGKAFAGVAAAYLGPRTMRSGCCGRCAPCRGW